MQLNISVLQYVEEVRIWKKKCAPTYNIFFSHPINDKWCLKHHLTSAENVSHMWQRCRKSQWKSNFFVPWIFRMFYSFQRLKLCTRQRWDEVVYFNNLLPKHRTVLYQQLLLIDGRVFFKVSIHGIAGEFRNIGSINCMEGLSFRRLGESDRGRDGDAIVSSWVAYTLKFSTWRCSTSPCTNVSMLASHQVAQNRSQASWSGGRHGRNWEFHKVFLR